jgi:(2Fe-2S) ferredoxin
VRRDGTPLKPPMGYAWYARVSDDDLNAVVAYLRTLPPLE